MNRLDKFQISKAPYAVQLSGFTVEQDEAIKRVEIPAIWFRRKDGITSAAIGTLWDYVREAPADAETWLRETWDGRYGGNAQARWDGLSLWAPDVTWDGMVAYQSLLANVLANFPDVPEGYDGWWTFKRPA